jgi:hypothetical protein
MTVPLPVVNALDAITIPAHCPVSWDEMAGDDRSRFCARCHQQVHDISELTTDEALALVNGVQKPPCVRIYRRPDGRVMTADCATKYERAWKWLRRRSGRVASLFALLLLSGCRTATQGAIPQDYLSATRAAGEASKQAKSPPP